MNIQFGLRFGCDNDRAVPSPGLIARDWGVAVTNKKKEYSNPLAFYWFCRLQYMSSSRSFQQIYSPVFPAAGAPEGETVNLTPLTLPPNGNGTATEPGSAVDPHRMMNNAHLAPLLSATPHLLPSSAAPNPPPPRRVVGRGNRAEDRTRLTTNRSRSHFDLPSSDDGGCGSSGSRSFLPILLSVFSLSRLMLVRFRIVSPLLCLIRRSRLGDMRKIVVFLGVLSLSSGRSKRTPGLSRSILSAPVDRLMWTRRNPSSAGE
jgi:hypothetical protein